MDADLASPRAEASVALPRGLALAAVGLALAAGAHGAAFWAFRDRGASAGDHAAAAAFVRARSRAGDLVFFLPAYATRGREGLGDLDTLAVRAPLAEDLEARDRVWLYALEGAAEGVAQALTAAGHEQRAARRFGGLDVRLFSLAPPRAEVRWRALDALREAEVAHVQPDGRAVPCARWARLPLGGKWVCPESPAWLYVGPEHHKMGEHVRACLWAHPPRAGRLEIRYPEVPLGGTLAIWAGHTLNASKRAEAPVFLDVGIGDGPEQRFVVALEDTWRPFRLATPTATTATVTFAVSSPNNGANHFCFVADTREVPR